MRKEENARKKGMQENAYIAFSWRAERISSALAMSINVLQCIRVEKPSSQQTYNC